MGQGPAPLVAAIAIGQTVSAALPFRIAGQLRVAVIVKATFILVPDRPMAFARPDPLVVTDQHTGRDPKSSLLAAADLVPHRVCADVLLTGHARAPMGRKTALHGARLLVARGDDVLVDKHLLVRGPLDTKSGAAAPAPFASMPIVYELAAGGPANPAGIGDDVAAWPSIVDASQRPLPVGFGPIASAWPARRRLLGDRALPDVAGSAIVDYPRDFPWAYFSAAPPDQQIDFLHGDEWIGFDGMHSQLPRVQSCLPGVRGAAIVQGLPPDPAASRSLALQADTLCVDADRMRASVVWRASFPLASDSLLPALRIFAGVETASQPLVLPTAAELALRAAARSQEQPAPSSRRSRAPKSKRRGAFRAFTPTQEETLDAPPDTPPPTTLDMPDAPQTRPVVPFAKPSSPMAIEPPAPVMIAPPAPAAPVAVAPVAPPAPPARLDVTPPEEPSAPAEPAAPRPGLGAAFLAAMERQGRRGRRAEDLASR